MKYEMYNEILEQPQSLKNLLNEEKTNMENISSILFEMDNIYLVGCGSSLSTCYSVKSAINMEYDIPIDIFTGYEFLHSKKLTNKNSVLIATSQSGETADTLAALNKAKSAGLETVTITNEENSSMMNIANHSIYTHCGRENAILGTKTYITQLFSLYKILFGAFDTENSKNILSDLNRLPNIIKDLIKSTEKDNKYLAKKFANEEIFYCMGSGPNYGLAYKLTMTMFMEGALKHSCSLYSGEFRHGLIERVEPGVSTVFLCADYAGDKLTHKAINLCEKLDCKNIIFDMKDYSDVNQLLSPFIIVIPLEWFIYYLAHFNNEDPGSTRHIGKVRY